MKIWLESVQLRLPGNGSLAITIPDGTGGRAPVLGSEWDNRGTVTRPAAFAAIASGSRIRATFSSDVITPFSVRAGADAGDSQNVLGHVAVKQVAFSGGSAAALMNLPSPRFGTVRKHDDVWLWFFQDGGMRTPFENPTSRHTVYSVLKKPLDPWNTGEDDTKPWLEALDLACDWASGAKNEREALTRITQAFYRLGQAMPRKFAYQADSTRFTEASLFKLQEFLDYLFDKSRHCGCVDPSACGSVDCGAVSCSACATIISTLANVVGARSSQEVILHKLSRKFKTAMIQLVGSTVSAQVDFQSHEVAWDGGADEDGDRVWDGCTGKAPLVGAAKAFVNLPYGDGLPNYRLSAIDIVDAAFIVRFGDVQTRSIGRTQRAFRALPPSDERRFGFRDWVGTFRGFQGLALWSFFFQPGWIADWKLERASRFDGAERPWLHDMVFDLGNRKLAISVVECTTREQAHFTLVEMLGGDRQDAFEGPSGLAIGDVCFHDPQRVPNRLLFALGNVVVRLRKAPGDALPLDRIAAELDRRLAPDQRMANNLVPEPQPKGNPFLLPVKAPDRKDRTRWLRIWSSTSELRVEDSEVSLETPNAGGHTIFVEGHSGLDLEFSSTLQFNVV